MTVAYPKSSDPLFNSQLYALTPKKLVVAAEIFIDKDFVTINVYTSRVKFFFLFLFCKTLSASFRLENLTMILFFYNLSVAGDTILSSLDLHVHQ